MDIYVIKTWPCSFVDDNPDGSTRVRCPECGTHNNITSHMITIESGDVAEHFCSVCSYPLYYSTAFSW